MSRDIVADAMAEHAMYFHLYLLAHNCGVENADDVPRWRAAFAVRDLCADRMRGVLATLADEVREDERHRIMQAGEDADAWGEAGR